MGGFTVETFEIEPYIDEEEQKATLKQIHLRQWNCKSLVEGSLISFIDENGFPLKAVKHQTYWSLESPSFEEEGSRYLSPEYLFTVERRGSYYGFRSCGAEGRFLQALRNNKEKPRITNYNFGPWESWSLSGSRIINCAWKTELPWSLCESRVQLLSVLHEAELNQRNEIRELRSELMQEKDRSLQVEGDFKNAIHTCQKQMDFAAKEIDDMQAKLAQSLTKNQCLSTEIFEYKEFNRRLENSLSNANQDKDELERTSSDLQVKVKELGKELAREQTKHKEKLKKISSQFSEETRKLKAIMGDRIKQVEEENLDLRSALDSIASKISVFSAKNSPVDSKSAKLMYESDAANDVSEICSIAESNDSDASFHMEDDSIEISKVDVESEVSKGSDAVAELDPKPNMSSPEHKQDIEGSPVLSDLINLDSPLFEETSNETVTNVESRSSPMYEAEGSQGGKSLDGNTVVSKQEHPDFDSSLSKLQTLLASLQKGEREDSLLQKEPSSGHINSDEDIPNIESENVDPEGLRSLTAQEGVRKGYESKRSPLKDVPAVNENEMRVTLGRKRIMAPVDLPQSEAPVKPVKASSHTDEHTGQDDADWESEDWWNSFTMRRSMTSV